VLIYRRLKKSSAKFFSIYSFVVLGMGRFLPTQLPICMGKVLKGTGRLMGVSTVYFNLLAKTRYATPESIIIIMAKTQTNDVEILPNLVHLVQYTLSPPLDYVMYSSLVIV
jgi:hypothetical protein